MTERHGQPQVCGQLTGWSQAGSLGRCRGCAVGERESGRSHPFWGRQVAPQGVCTTGCWRSQSDEGVGYGEKGGRVRRWVQDGREQGSQGRRRGERGNLPGRENGRDGSGSRMCQSEGSTAYLNRVEPEWDGIRSIPRIWR